MDGKLTISYYLAVKEKIRKFPSTKIISFFFSIVIKAKPFSIPAAASGTKASPIVQGENQMLWEI